jgi:hypothetical protein
MIRNLKVLGLALAAFFAFAAVASSSAFAAEEEFHCETAHCILTASQENNQVFTTEAGTTTCTAVKGDATLEKATVMEVTATGIEYTGCTTKTIFGEIAVTVNFNGCDYNFTTSTKPVHLICPVGKEVVIEGPGCKITVPGGQSLEQVHYSNIGAGTTREVTIESTVTNIKESATGFFCSKTGTFTNGKYTGNIKITGEETAKIHEGVWYL